MPNENRAPVDAEQTLDDVPVMGRLPPGLSGTLYRNGPNPMDPNPARHWFFGDGMVHAFRIEGGRVSYRNRWVRTQSWARGAGQPEGDLPEGVANTSLVFNAGRLLALEEAHMPVALDRASLATRGVQDFGGALPKGPFTAHPKPCPATGGLVFFGYGAEGVASGAIRVGEVSADGELRALEVIRGPYGAMTHDFAVTERFIAVPLFPLVLDAQRRGFVWKPELGAFLGVIERARGLDSLRWLTLPRGFAFHVANAWDEGATLAVDLMLSDAPPLFPGPPGEAADTRAFLTRLEVDLSAPEPRPSYRRLSEAPGELPRIDERRAGLRSRRVFWAADGAIRARDDRDGSETAFLLPEGDSTSEPVFVPRGAAEGDGWIMAVLYRGASKTSDLAVLDAADLASGPVALARLPVRVPDGFHGAWSAEA